jgi:DNA mismatch repair endonuclease MutH
MRVTPSVGPTVRCGRISIDLLFSSRRGGALRAFDYRTASVDEILRRAEELEGKHLGEIPGAKFTASDPRRGRQEVGHAIEAWFGIPPNPTRGPDFPAAGIELKSVPVERKPTGYRIKERTVVSLIDYVQFGLETWATASVRSKLNILFVFFEHIVGGSKADFPVHSSVLWSLEGEVEAQVKRDWEAVHTKVLAGLAHELTETDGLILGPCTKGADSSVLRRQPFSDTRAKSRAFALKPSFTKGLFVEPDARPLQPKELVEAATLDEMQLNFNRFVGREVRDVAREVGVEPSKRKDYAAWVVRNAVIASSPLRPEEFKAAGPTLRTPRVGANLLPYEAVSFPHFVILELTEEDWEDSGLLAHVEYMLFAPVFGESRRTPPQECVIRPPIYWQPNTDQLETIKKEWTMFRDLIGVGKGDSLPHESDTHAIHVRPHGRNAADRDTDKRGQEMTKKSFWLNKRFVQEILEHERD